MIDLSCESINVEHPACCLLLAEGPLIKFLLALRGLVLGFMSSYRHAINAQDAQIFF